MYVVGSVLLASYALLGVVGNVAVSSPPKNRAHTHLVKALSRHGMLGRLSKEKGHLAGAKLRAMAAQKIEMPAVTEYDPPNKSDRIEMPAVDKDDLPDGLKRQDRERDLSPKERQKLVEEGLRGMMSEEFKKKLEQLKKQQPTSRQ